MELLRKFILAIAAVSLTACKLSGIGVNIEQPVVIQDIETGEVLELTEDGRFNFKNDYKSGDRYAIQVLESAQSCDVINGEGTFAKQDIKNIEVNCESSVIACPLIYMPVCGIKTIPIVCVTTPCEPLTKLKTFGNACQANAEDAPIVFQGTCGDLEGEDVSSFYLTPFKTTRFAQSDPVTIIGSRLNEALLKLTVSYSGGCARHEFNFYGDTEFKSEGGEITMLARLGHKSNNDLCEAIVLKDVYFSLLPVKEKYKREFNTEYGEIHIPVAPRLIPDNDTNGVHKFVYRFDDRPAGQVGDICGGYTMWPGHPACAAGLTCKDSTPWIADDPGTCQAAE